MLAKRIERVDCWVGLPVRGGRSKVVEEEELVSCLSREEREVIDFGDGGESNSIAILRFVWFDNTVYRLCR